MSDASKWESTTFFLPRKSTGHDDAEQPWRRKKRCEFEIYAESLARCQNLYDLVIYERLCVRKFLRCNCTAECIVFDGTEVHFVSEFFFFSGILYRKNGFEEVGKKTYRCASFVYLVWMVNEKWNKCELKTNFTLNFISFHFFFFSFLLLQILITLQSVNQ